MVAILWISALEMLTTCYDIIILKGNREDFSNNIN